MRSASERQFRTRFARQEDVYTEVAFPNRAVEDEVNLIDYIRIIYKYRWMIIVLTLIAMGSLAAFTVFQPRVYQAHTSIVPPIDSLMQGRGALAGKLSGAGSMLFQGLLNEGNLSELYVGILESIMHPHVIFQVLFFRRSSFAGFNIPDESSPVAAAEMDAVV